MPRTRYWHVSGWRLLLLAPLLLLLLPFWITGMWLFGWGGETADLTPGEVADYLRNFIEGKGDDGDWDDFTSVPITNPWLEDIRREAEQVQLPADDQGMAKLKDLLARVDAVRGQGAPG